MFDASTVNVPAVATEPEKQGEPTLPYAAPPELTVLSAEVSSSTASLAQTTVETTRLPSGVAASATAPRASNVDALVPMNPGPSGASLGVTPRLACSYTPT